MSKQDYTIKEVDKKVAKPFLGKYHYLSKKSKGFRTKYNFGLHKGAQLVGICIFTGFSVKETAKGLFGSYEQDGLYELSRLCLAPKEQETEHNLASWFVSRCIKKLRRTTGVKAILSYADSDYHKGTVYRACNFKYYGLSKSKNDFWIKNEDGTFIKHNRGPIAHLSGEWRPRSRKHRYLIVYDKNLKIHWEEQKVTNFFNYKNHVKMAKIIIELDANNGEEKAIAAKVIGMLGAEAGGKPEAETKEEKPKPARKPRAKAGAKKAAPTPPAEPAEPEEDDDLIGGDDGGEDKVYTLNQLKELISANAKKHKDAIKAKLEELGAPKLTQLDKSDWSALGTFLEGLK